MNWRKCFIFKIKILNTRLNNGGKMIASKKRGSLTKANFTRFGLFFVFILFISNSYSQIKQDLKKDYLSKPHESAENIRLHPVTKEKTTTPAYYFSSERFFAAQVNVDPSGNNIVGDAANEPSIAVDLNNSDRMAIGWRQFETIENSFRQAGYGYTTNGGETWTFPAIIEPELFRSDPVLDSDAEGNFYYNSLSINPYTCDVFKSTDGGKTWGEPVYARGGDKQWMVIDKTDGPGKGNVYSFWTSAFTICDSGFFTRSVNNGLSYNECIEVPKEPYWGTLAVGPEGELYILGFGENEYILAKSSNAKYPDQEVFWDFTTDVNLEGTIHAFGSGSPNPRGLLGQAWVAVDNYSDSYKGNLYALCSVQPYAKSDPLEVMFARSTDGGETFSEAVKINDDEEGAWQWFGTMSVAPNGRIDVVWLDTRNDPGGVNSELFYSFSFDAGESWAPNEKLSESFDPHIGWPQQNKMGDYFHMVSENDKVHLAWAATFNGEQDVYYGRITPDIVGVEESLMGSPEEFLLLTNYPNPFNGETTIKYHLPYKTNVKVELFNVLGQKLATLLEKEEGPGYNTLSLSSDDLESGVYFYRLSSDTFSVMEKLIVLK